MYFFSWTTTHGIPAFRTTYSLTLPRINRLTAPMPRVPITIISAFSSMASWQIPSPVLLNGSPTNLCLIWERQTSSPPIGWARQNAAPLKFDQKSSEAAFSVVFSNFGKCWPEVARDVTGAVVDRVGLEVRVKFGDCRLNNGRIIRLFAWPDPLYAPLRII